MYTIFPSVSIVVVPCAGADVTDVTESVSLSTSLSFARTMTVIAVPSGVVSLSSYATGASFTALTSIFTSAVSVPSLPSEIAYVKVSGPT